ncbi:MAG: hypothetical protein M3470_04690 [Chloroflexota bacterium]|nr:hypothetical protein [Chloroflexota bacterium]
MKDQQPQPKADDVAKERVVEQEQGISPERRGSSAAPSDKPEGDTPHPQDVNDIAR